METTEYTRRYLEEVCEIASLVDGRMIDRMVELLCETRARGGRVFFLGVGGGAGHAGHAVNDFRKIAGMECYAPTDNVSELTARVNDDGWESCYANWLRRSHLRTGDMVFVFSVGGGSARERVSMRSKSETIPTAAENSWRARAGCSLQSPARSRRAIGRCQTTA